MYAKHTYIYKVIDILIKFLLVKNLFIYCFCKVTKLYYVGYNKGKGSQKSIWLNS